MDCGQFVDTVVREARKGGYRIETNRKGQTQIDFGNKKLHTGQLAQLFPAILESNANVAKLIDKVAPGRPCTHRPMRQFLAGIR